ncbi:MAG: hypothetical protein ACOCZK_05705 [Planctomycetota bacterium]
MEDSEPPPDFIPGSRIQLGPALGSAAAARCLVRRLAAIEAAAPEGLDTLAPIAAAISEVSSDEALGVVWNDALPRIVDLVAEHGAAMGEQTALYLFKLFVAAQHIGGVEEMLSAIRRGQHRDGYLWGDIFDQLLANRSLALMVVESLDRCVPAGYCGVAYLEMANALMREGALPEHPYDTPEGRERLRDLLLSTEDVWYAQSAAGSLPFVGGADQIELITMARCHPLSEVRLEAARAAAAMGDLEALEVLAHHAANPVDAGTAIAYLQELDSIDRLPIDVYDPAFQAQVAMVAWLSDPSEFGQPPAEVAVVDRRRLFWPPLNREIEVFLVRFVYDFPEVDERATFIGMVGSVTAALLGEVDPETMDYADIYGMHCCWELERMHDPRAPAVRSPQTGRRILDLENPGAGF